MLSRNQLIKTVRIEIQAAIRLQPTRHLIALLEINMKIESQLQDPIKLGFATKFIQQQKFPATTDIRQWCI
jgi:hypothetical protein